MSKSADGGLAVVGRAVPGTSGRCWRVETRVGSGTCCTVWRVHLDDDPTVQGALKVYEAGDVYEAASRREKLLLSLVRSSRGRSPFIVEVIDSFQWQGRACLVETSLEADVRQIMLKNLGKALSLPTIQLLTRQILNGLSVLHSVGFVHGDLKPENLLWNPQEGALTIIDFGLSFHVKDKRVGLLQSQGYRAPECEAWNSLQEARSSSTHNDRPSESSSHLMRSPEGHVKGSKSTNMPSTSDQHRSPVDISSSDKRKAMTVRGTYSAFYAEGERQGRVTHTKEDSVIRKNFSKRASPYGFVGQKCLREDDFLHETKSNTVSLSDCRTAVWEASSNTKFYSTLPMAVSEIGPDSAPNGNVVIPEDPVPALFTRTSDAPQFSTGLAYMSSHHRRGEDMTAGSQSHEVAERDSGCSEEKTNCDIVPPHPILPRGALLGCSDRSSASLREKNAATDAGGGSADIDVARPSEAADLWSVGCVIMEMIIGMKFLNSQRRTAIKESKEKGNSSMLHDFVKNIVQKRVYSSEASTLVEDWQSLTDLCIRLLEDDPLQRPSASEALNHPFFSVNRGLSPRDMLVLPTRILRLGNVFERNSIPQFETDDILKDIQEECEKYGKVLNIHLSTDPTPKVFVEFQSWMACLAAAEAITRMRFDDRYLMVSYFPVEDYQKTRYY